LAKCAPADNRVLLRIEFQDRRTRHYASPPDAWRYRTCEAAVCALLRVGGRRDLEW